MKLQRRSHGKAPTDLNLQERHRELLFRAALAQWDPGGEFHTPAGLILHGVFDVQRLCLETVHYVAPSGTTCVWLSSLL